MDRSIDWEKIENEQGSKLFIGKEMAKTDFTKGSNYTHVEASAYRG